MAQAFHVHKFGGTSVRDAARIEQVTRILDASPSRRVVVVSALGGTTDALLSLVERAAARDETVYGALQKIIARHEAVADALLDDESRGVLGAQFELQASDLADMLRATWLLRRSTLETREVVAGFGELWSAALLAQTRKAQGVPALFLDARRFLTVSFVQGRPKVDWETSRRLLRAQLPDDETEVIITGFIARRDDDTPTTLGRNGSDFSASIVAALLGAEDLTIWTDVDGVLTADPQSVPDARVTPQLTYDEAAELATFGARVIHPHTMAPVIEQAIPVWIKNAARPDGAGTRIAATIDDDTHDGPVKGFSIVDDILLLNLEGPGMLGVVGVAERMFRALSDEQVSVVMISQASSEHSICVATKAGDADRAEAAIRRAFAAEILDGQIRGVERSAPCAILAAVGHRMAETPGVSGRFFSALGKAGVNVRAVAQGSSERNISAVVDQDDATRGLLAVHASFTLSDQTLSVGLIGPGLIGSALLAQLERRRDTLRERFGVDLRVRAVANSTRMLLDDQDALSGWSDRLRTGAPTDLDAFAAHVAAPHLPHAVIIDCTASSTIAARTPEWLATGMHVVTPNKQACSGPASLVAQIAQARRACRTQFYYEATVGAGLPILSTLRDLRETGDGIMHIEGVLSGTLSYLFNSFDGSQPFSQLVRQAQAQGFTEPDPRDDLAGTDVARKVVILGREMGLSLSLDDIHVESLVPEPLREVASVDAFLDGLAAHDASMAARLGAAQRDGAVLRYLGRVDDQGRGEVKLVAQPSRSPFARLSGSDNLIAFTTERYREQPLIVQGPGAGPEVTAAGVFSDLLRLCAHLGATF